MENSKNFGYAKKTTTNITYEEPSQDNPFVPKSSYLHGYNILDLVEKKSFVEVLFLLFTSELPSTQQTTLLNALMVGLINPGPRSPDVRASMTAGVSKSNPSHLLPIGLLAGSGLQNGASEVEKSMLFLRESFDKKNAFITDFKKSQKKENAPEIKIAPGFGSHYGSRCHVIHQLADYLATLSESSSILKWVHSQILEIEESDFGWLSTGLAAAVFLDLGIKAREGIALFQLLTSPGIAAHGFEQTHKPLSSMPFLDDSQYEFKR